LMQAVFSELPTPAFFVQKIKFLTSGLVLQMSRTGAEHHRASGDA